MRAINFVWRKVGSAAGGAAERVADLVLGPQMTYEDSFALEDLTAQLTHELQAKKLHSVRKSVTHLYMYLYDNLELLGTECSTSNVETETRDEEMLTS